MARISVKEFLDRLESQRQTLIAAAIKPLVAERAKVSARLKAIDDEVNDITSRLMFHGKPTAKAAGGDVVNNGLTAGKKKSKRVRRGPDVLAKEFEGIATLIKGAGKNGIGISAIKKKFPKALAGAQLIAKLKDSGHKVSMTGDKASALYHYGTGN